MAGIQKISNMFFGGLLIAIGINGCIVPHDLMEGGALGISLMFYYLFQFKIGLTFLLISLPIFMIALFVHRPFFFNGLHGMIWSSWMIDWWAPLALWKTPLHTHPLASAFLGGFLIGLGVGMMLRFEISIGGLDLLAQMTAEKFQINPGFVIFIFDLTIVSLGSVLISSLSFILSFIVVLTMGVTISSLVAIKKDRPKHAFRNFTEKSIK